jgi:molybdopterin molybdotransferase
VISVEEAMARIVASLSPVEAERVAIGRAAGRVLAHDAKARMTQPPAPMSSMDGYAVKAEDVATVPSTLRVIGSAPAGHPFRGTVGSGEAVRIFTGGVVPEGADAIVIQEDTSAAEDRVTVTERGRAGRHIRVAGLDFQKDQVLARAGRRLTARDVSLLAAGNIDAVMVRRKPQVAVAATGDELSPPGMPQVPGGIVASSSYGLSAMIEAWGAAATDLGILPDTMDAVAQIADHAAAADLVVTLGGASVGDHDLIQRALGPRGFELDFWKIAMRPGKPLIFGRLDRTPLLGLPGNPVSTFVCAILFLRPAIAALLGTETAVPRLSARLLAPLAANEGRQDYVRARLEVRDGEYWAEPFQVQDSAMMSTLAAADALIVRPPHAPAAMSGARIEILSLANC